MFDSELKSEKKGQKAYKVKNSVNDIQVPGVTLFGGYARFSIHFCLCSKIIRGGISNNTTRRT